MATRIDARHTGGYESADAVNEYSYDSGVVVLPVAQRTAGHKIIRLHGGVGMRRAKWTSTRAGNPPIVPAMGDTTGDTFISGTISPCLPVPSTSDPRGYDWKVSGEYVWVQNAPRVAGTDPFPVGQHPFACASQSEYAASVVGSAMGTYTGTNPFASFVAAVQARVKVNPDGSYVWPILALPTALQSDHIFQD